MATEAGQKEGQIIHVSLPQRTPQGHEQGGTRPCILIADPSSVHQLRYPMLIIVPLTTRLFPNRSLYPRLEKGMGKLPESSIALLDQLTAIDAKRVQGYIGVLSAEEFTPIQRGLSRIFKHVINSQ